MGTTPIRKKRVARKVAATTVPETKTRGGRDEDRIPNAAARLMELKGQIKTLNDEAARVEEELLSWMEAREKKKEAFDFGSITRVQNEVVRTDPQRLKKALGAKMWEAITTRVLDQNKLDAHVKSGEIDTTVIAECSEVNLSKPYIRVYPKKV